VTKATDKATIPHNEDAEQSVLGSMLRDNVTIGDVVQIVRAGDFYTDRHQKIFSGIVELYDRVGKVDSVTLADLLAQRKQVEDVGGYVYLGELWSAAPTAANAEHYAQIVREKAVLRGLICAGSKIAIDARDQIASADELLEQADRAIMAVAQSGLAGQTVTLGELLPATCQRIDDRHRNGQQGSALSGLATGFLDLDNKTAGLQNAELIVLAARPSAGKTALALCIARHVAVEERLPVFFVSLEQTASELSERLLCCQARVDSYRVRGGLIDREDADRLSKASKQLCGAATVLIEDSPGQGMLRIAANARRHKLRHGIRLVIVDYLQLIEPDSRREPRHEQVAGISRRLKHLAREVELPVMALAQLNREPENRQGNRPRLSDLRESGGIECDADVVMLLHRPELCGDSTRPGVVDVIIAKQRNGPIGDVTLTFQKQFMRFENYEPDWPNEEHVDRPVSVNGTTHAGNRT
jgi:replicative DNA helicase